MNRLFGLETEYGITVEDVDEIDVVEESMQIIRCYLQHDFVPLWDYALENPRRDLRGFEVDQLLNDEDEKVHLQKDRKRKVPFKELKSDLIIFNGARLYNDHTHPEYSTPECWNLRDLVAQDRAGERILAMCASKRTEMLKQGRVKLYKNNTDFDGHSYGCHENYLMRRDIPFDRIVHGLLPFLVTRQIFAGAGKVGVEQGDRARLYQISQRGEFFEVIASVDTMHNRPLINTRDEPHADPQRYRRLHVILGDANMCEVITALKVGTAALVCDLIEDDDLPGLTLKDPVITVKDIARDQSHRWLVHLGDSRLMPAVDVQREYLSRAEKRYRGRDTDTYWTLNRWAGILDDLEADPTRLIGVCDWVTKKWLLDQFAEAEGLSWANDHHLMWLQSQDLEYSNIDPENGLFHLLEAQGRTEALLDEEDVKRAISTPPEDTRGYFRGRCLDRFGSSVRSVNWDSIVFGVNGTQRAVDLKSFVDRDVARRFNTALDRAGRLEELLAHLP
ncbi:MAG: peptidase [Verrucomicrobia bacterium RIFCSPLOWO2_12_FULL_64_8]|nr:MAG: peptidase [Verrucomicrobia bacterium RIFCSPLOWO2_12_FULL_64_8]